MPHRAMITVGVNGLLRLVVEFSNKWMVQEVDTARPAFRIELEASLSPKSSKNRNLSKTHPTYLN